MSYVIQKKSKIELNRLYEEDKSIHDWYRFVLSYPPHLIRSCINKFNLSPQATVLDPFCGTGTTLVEAKKLGYKSIGVEANPVVHMCASAKINWDLNIYKIKKISQHIAIVAIEEIEKNKNILNYPNEHILKLIIKDSMNFDLINQVLILLSIIEKYGDNYCDFYKTALAKHIVFSFSNLKFGPEVGVSKKKKENVNIVKIWLEQIMLMCDDLILHIKNKNISSSVILGDSRNKLSFIKNNSIDAVITSPPYPNEKDYSRATRLESVLLGFIKNKENLRDVKHNFLRSNTRNIYKGDDDFTWIEDNIDVRELADAIEKKRIELGKTSGFEKLYYKVVLLYFGGMAKHLYELRPKLKNGAQLAYVVGDQASYFRIPIKTSKLLEGIAENLGYRVVGCDVFRTRLSTITKEKLNEEILFLEYVNGRQ